MSKSIVEKINTSKDTKAVSTEAKKIDTKRKNTIISLKNVYKRFKVGNGYAEALKNISLDFYSTDFTIVYGASGCGKSTMLNTICGLEPPTTGEVTVRDVDVYSLNENERAQFRSEKFGVVYQMPYWVKSLNILENVAVPLLLQGMSISSATVKAHEELKRVGLQGYEDHLPTELSGGQQQKAAVARAIVSNPWIIVADEPTGNLDSKSAEEIMNLFIELNVRSRRSLIMVTHNLDYLELATRIIKMHDGEIVEIKEQNRSNALKRRKKVKIQEIEE